MSCKKALLMIFLVFWVWPNNGQSQEYAMEERLIIQSFEFPNVRWRQYKIDDGLIQNDIQDVVEDHNGYLWIGSDAGLSRFDGTTFDHFLQGISVNDLKIDSLSNRLFVATDNGLLWINTMTLSKPVETSVVTQVNKVIGPGGSTLYLATNIGILDYHVLADSANTMEGTSGKEYLSSFTISNSIFAGSKQGELLEISNHKIIRSLDLPLNAEASRISAPFYFSQDKNAQTIFFVADSNLENVFAVGIDFSVSRIDLKKMLIPESLVDNGARERFMQVRDHGRFVLNNDILRTFYSKDLFNVYLQSKNAEWIGTQTRGLYRIDVWEGNNYLNNAIELVDGRQLDSRKVWSISEDQKSNIWVGTEEGVNVFNSDLENITKSIPLLDTLKSKRITVLQKTDDSSMLVGTNQGLYLLNYSFKDRPRFSEIRLYDLILTISPTQEKNRFLVGDLSGRIYNVSTANGELDTLYSKKYASNVYDITTINNQLWISSRSDGLIKLDSLGSETRYDIRKTLNTEQVNDSILLVGTYGEGLYELNIRNDSINPIDIPNKYVYSLVSNEENKVWISTNRGLFLYDMMSKTFFPFTLEDGLQEWEFNSGAFYDSGSKIYLGGVNGFNVINTDKIEFDSTRLFAPKPLITTLNLLLQNDEEIPLIDSLEFSRTIQLDYTEYNNRPLLIGFTTPNFSKEYNPKYKYSFTAKGSDETWIELNGQQIILNNLKYGEYELKIQSTNILNNWSNSNATQTSIYFTLKRKRFWLLELGIYLFVLILIIAVFFRGALSRVLKKVRKKHEEDYERLYTEVQTLFSSTQQRQQLFLSSSDKPLPEIISDSLKYLMQATDSSISSFWSLGEDGPVLSSQQPKPIFILSHIEGDDLDKELMNNLSEHYYFNYEGSHIENMYKNKSFSKFEYIDEPHTGNHVWRKYETRYFKKQSILIIPVKRRLKNNHEDDRFSSTYGFIELRPKSKLDIAKLDWIDSFASQFGLNLDNSVFKTRFLKIRTFSEELGKIDFEDEEDFYNKISDLIQIVTGSQAVSLFFKSNDGKGLYLKGTTSPKFKNFHTGELSDSEKLIKTRERVYSIQNEDGVTPHIFNELKTQIVVDVLDKHQTNSKLVESEIQSLDISMIGATILDSSHEPLGVFRCVNKSDKFEFESLSKRVFLPLDRELIEFVSQVVSRIVEQFETNITREVFLNQFVHEVRGPLKQVMDKNTLEGYKYRTIKQGKVLIPYFRNIHVQMSLLKSIVSDVAYIYNYGGIEKELKIEYSSLNEIVGRVVSLTREESRIEKNLEIVQTSQFETDYIYMDQNKMTQAILNVVRNAVRYSNQRIKETPWDHIHVSCLEQVRIIDNVSKKYMIISVSNVGLEIPELEKDDIFTLFRRGSNAEQKSSQGTGIGLFLARAILHNHDGEILLKSNKNPVTFEICIPRRLKAEEP